MHFYNVLKLIFENFWHINNENKKQKTTIHCLASSHTPLAFQHSNFAIPQPRIEMLSIFHMSVWATSYLLGKKENKKQNNHKISQLLSQQIHAI